MQFIADIVKLMNIKGYITVDDLYKFSEHEIIQLIKNCDDSYIKNAFEKFQNATRDSVYKENTSLSYEKGIIRLTNLGWNFTEICIS